MRENGSLVYIHSPQIINVRATDVRTRIIFKSKSPKSSYLGQELEEKHKTICLSIFIGST